MLDAAPPTQELSIPPAIELDQAKGFGLRMLRAVPSGHGDEILDPAKINLQPR